MKKKIVSLLLVGAMALSMFAGCGSSSASTGNGGSNGTSADGTTKLTALFIAHPLTEDVEQMKWLEEIEKEAGVEVEWEVIRADWDLVKSTRFASGDVPDLIFNGTVDSDYTQYNGLFVDLTNYISAETTPNIQAMFEEEPDTYSLATLDGKIYGVPKFQGKWPACNGVMFINKQWLDNLGLEKPTTFSELETVLEAFKKEDANGNGDPNDEIPLDYNGWFGGAYSLTNLVGALGIQLTNWATDAYFAEDGQVKCYAVDERYKLLMKYFAGLYKKGLINENAVTNDYSTFQSLSRGNEAGDALVGCVMGWEETDKFGPTLHTQYEVLGALDYDIDCAAGTYDTRWINDFTGLNMSSNRVCITSNCKNVEAAMKFIDTFYDPTHSVEVLFGGISDGNIEKTSDSDYKVLDPLDPNTDAGTWKWTTAFADNGPMYIRRACNIEMAQDMTYALEEREVYQPIIDKSSKEDTYPQMFMEYTEAEQNTMAIDQANITNITDNQWALWLTGEQDIDATWDAYVDSVYAAGLQEVLDIRQAAFEKYLAQ